MAQIFLSNMIIYCNSYSKFWAIFQRIYLQNWDICHAVGQTYVSVYRISLPPEIGTILFQNTVHGDPLWCQCIDCCLVSGVMCTTHVSSLVMIRSRNSSPSSRYRRWNVNADSMLCSGVSCYALCIQNFIADLTSQSAVARIRASLFSRCNVATVRTRKVPLVHASCDAITLSLICSCFTQ